MCWGRTEANSAAALASSLNVSLKKVSCGRFAWSSVIAVAKNLAWESTTMSEVDRVEHLYVKPVTAGAQPNE